MSSTKHATRNTLEVKFPATDGFLRISRLNMSAYASNLGFDVDALDDLRLAVDEAVAWLLTDRSSEGTITLTISEIADDNRTGLRLEAERADANGEVHDHPVGDLAHAILGATVDFHRLERTETGTAVVMIEKYAQDSAG